MDVPVVSTTYDFEFTNVKLKEMEKLNQNKEEV
jgi:hypothetical protein